MDSKDLNREIEELTQPGADIEELQASTADGQQEVPEESLGGVAGGVRMPPRQPHHRERKE